MPLIEKTYLAVAHGHVLPLHKIIDAPIARVAERNIKRCVCKDGQNALTEYKVLKIVKNYSILAIKLHTGRTHQIRVHMEYIGHPLVGDWLYEGDDPNISRQALHAWKLSFPHPLTKKILYLTAPIPKDISALYTLQG